MSEPAKRKHEGGGGGGKKRKGGWGGSVSGMGARRGLRRPPRAADAEKPPPLRVMHCAA